MSLGQGGFRELLEWKISTTFLKSTFEEMILNGDTVNKALSFRNSIERFEFIISMVITRQVFDMTMDVTKLLQARDNDVMKTISLIEALKDQFSNIRSKVDLGLW